MPTILTYNYSYSVTGSVGGSLTVVSSLDSGAALDITHTDADGVDDDMVALSGTVQVGLTSDPSGGPTGTFQGFTSTGDPILFVGSGVGAGLFVYSDTFHADGFVFPGSSATGPYLFCFAPGTAIATPDGNTAVEHLAPGDRVQTDGGGAVPVKWIGRQTVHKLFAGPHMQPVRIRAGALGGGLPHSDLTVTADHGMIIDGLVINASALINGTTIAWMPMDELPDRVTYYHVETEDHDVILANGAPAETFVDYAGRQAFDNYQEYVDLYGAERIVHEMDRPRISSQRLVPEAIRARLGIVEPEIDWGAPLTA